MKTLTLAIALFSGIVLTTSCSNKAKIVKLNNELISVTDSMTMLSKQWEVTLTNNANLKDFSRLTPVRKNIQDYISRKQTELKGLEDVGGSEKFRKAILDFLTIEQGTLKVMESFESLNANSTQADMQKIAAGLQTVSAQETAAVSEIRKEQALFAQQNNIPLITR